MSSRKTDLAAVARELLAVEGLFDQRDPHLSVTLYRLLAEGTPVSADRFAERAGRPVSEVADWIRGGDRVDVDDAGTATTPSSSARWQRRERGSLTATTSWSFR